MVTLGLEDSRETCSLEVSLLSTRKPTEVEWRFTEAGERVRVSTRSGGSSRNLMFPELMASSLKHGLVRLGEGQEKKWEWE